MIFLSQNSVYALTVQNGGSEGEKSDVYSYAWLDFSCRCLVSTIATIETLPLYYSERDAFPPKRLVSLHLP